MKTSQCQAVVKESCLSDIYTTNILDVCSFGTFGTSNMVNTLQFPYATQTLWAKKGIAILSHEFSFVKVLSVLRQVRACPQDLASGPRQPAIGRLVRGRRRRRHLRCTQKPIEYVETRERTHKCTQPELNRRPLVVPFLQASALPLSYRCCVSQGSPPTSYPT